MDKNDTPRRISEVLGEFRRNLLNEGFSHEEAFECARMALDSLLPSVVLDESVKA